MKLVFYSNIASHHIGVLSDQLYALLSDSFVLVLTVPVTHRLLKGGEDYSSRKYCVLAGDSDESFELAMKYAREAETCVFFGTNSLKYAIERVKNGRRDGLSFDWSERWLKRGTVNMLSPRLLKMWVAYFVHFRSNKFYKLCSSAFAAKDHYALGMYRGRCYKWGYFTRVEDNGDSKFTENRQDRKEIAILWCARFIPWKHPERALRIAKKLKNDGYVFHLDMIGSGDIKSEMMSLSTALGLDGVVSFMGNMSNQDVLREMSKHQIFLFTSDKNEGWGAVANESMGQGCVLVGSDAIGAVPFLVKDGENGLIFKDGDENSLYAKVRFLLDNPEELVEMSKKARETMVRLWSPEIAARNLLILIDDLKAGRDTSIIEGPCSKA